MVAAPVTLRPYQHESLAAIDGKLARHRSTLLVLPTGCGKTTVFSVAAQREVQRGVRVLVLADREELLDQARKRLELFGVDARIEQAARTAGAARAVVASVATMVRRLDRYAPDAFGLIIEDECQHSPAASRTKIREHFRAAKVLGVTATPDRADGKPLAEVYESVAYQYDIRDAIRDIDPATGQSYLVPISARRVVVDAVDLRALKAGKGGDFVQADLAKVMEAERAVHGVVVPLLELAADRRTVVFAASVQHARMLTEAINDRRPDAAVLIHGELEREDRKRRLADYAAGRYQFVCNVDVLTEGWDDPPTSCVAMVRPTKSRARYVQAAGRGLRPSPATGKRDCLILDFTGTAGKHALCGPADCLAGKDELAEDVRAEIERLLGTAQLEISTVIAAAEDEAERRRAERQVAAVVRWHAEQVDPFVGRTGSVALPSDKPPAWSGSAASEPQLAAIAELTKGALGRDNLPPGFSRSDAWRLLVVLKSREREQLCTYAQAKKLFGYGIETRQLSKQRAGQLITMLVAGGWRKAAIVREPEMADARGADLAADDRADLWGAA